jgi:dipeptidase E
LRPLAAKLLLFLYFKEKKIHMKRRDFIRTSSALGAAPFLPTQEFASPLSKRPNAGQPTIFVTGGSSDDSMMKFFISLTGKENPRICLLPTASADRDSGIIRWFERADGLGFQPFVQRMFISSYRQDQTFEEVLLSMDAIWVSGGNTLNMIAIWKAQGVDQILKKAWEQGIVLGGGSAGSICWFEQGSTDSRPVALSAMDALGFLKGSHCPHYYTEGPRRDSYHEMILDGRLMAGYALDDRVGLLFEGQELKKVVASREGSKGFHVSKVGGKIVEKELEAEVLR